jgi:hypothetical protein
MQQPPWYNQPQVQQQQPLYNQPQFPQRAHRSTFASLENILLVLIGINWLSKRIELKNRRPLITQGKQITISITNFIVLDYSNLRVFFCATNSGELDGERDFEVYVDARVDNQPTGDGRMQGTVRLAAHERSNQYLDVFVSNSQAINVIFLNQVSIILDPERTN